MSDPLLAYRDKFPILDTSTYMINNSLGAMPGAVAERMQDYSNIWATRASKRSASYSLSWTSRSTGWMRRCGWSARRTRRRARLVPITWRPTPDDRDPEPHRLCRAGDPL